MKNHSEIFQAIEKGVELQFAAEAISKTESGYTAKITSLWQKTGQALAKNGSIQTANALLDELKAFYPANRLGEKAKAIAKASTEAGFTLHYYQLIAGRGNPSAFHLEPPAPTKAQEAKALAQCVRELEKDAKSDDKVLADIAKEMLPEYKGLADAAKTALAEDRKTAKLQAIYDDLMADILTIAELEQVILAATADKLAAQIAADQEAKIADPIHVQDAEDPTFWHYAHHAA